MLLGAGLFRSVQPLQRTPVRHLGLHLPAALCISTLYSQTVNSYFDIPIEIYKVWKYSEEYDLDTLYINRERSIVVDVDIFRRVDDPHRNA